MLRSTTRFIGTGRFIGCGKYVEMTRIGDFLKGNGIACHLNNIGDGYWNLFVDYDEDGDRARELGRSGGLLRRDA